MARRHSISLRTVNTSDDSAGFEIKGAAIDMQSLAPLGRIVEVGVTLAAATASTFGLGRAATAGESASAVTLARENLLCSASSAFTAAVAWDAEGEPTQPTSFIRRTSLPAQVGASVVWQFPEGIHAESLVLWNIGATGVADIWVVAEE